jgi:ribosomal protein S26
MKSVEFGKERKKAVDLSSQVSANVEFPFSCKLATLGTETRLHCCVAATSITMRPSQLKEDGDDPEVERESSKITIDETSEAPMMRPKFEVENLASMVYNTNQAIKNVRVLLQTINPQAEKFLQSLPAVGEVTANECASIAVDVNDGIKDEKANKSCHKMTPESKSIQQPTESSVKLESAVRDRINATNNVRVLLERELEKGRYTIDADTFTRVIFSLASLNICNYPQQRLMLYLSSAVS